MAYSRQTEPNRIEPQEGEYDHQQFHHANQHLSSRQVRLGFDQLVEEINSKSPLSESEKEENTCFAPDAPNVGSEWQSIYGVHPRHLREFTSQSPDLSQLQFGKTSAIGFNPAVLPTCQLTNEGAFWRNPTGKHHGAEDPRFNALTPSSTGLDRCKAQGESGTERHNYYVELEGDISSPYSPYSMDSISNREKRGGGDMDLVEPSLVFSKDSFLPRASENVPMENMEVHAMHTNVETITQYGIALMGNKVKWSHEGKSISIT